MVASDVPAFGRQQGKLAALLDSARRCPLQVRDQSKLARSPPLRIVLDRPVAKSKEVGNLLMIYAAMRGIATHNGDTALPTLMAEVVRRARGGERKFEEQRCGNAALHMLMNEGPFCCDKNPQHKVRERAFGRFDAKLAHVRGGVHSVALYGYLQSWKYWCHVADDLRAELRSLFLLCLDADAQFSRLAAKSARTGTIASLRAPYRVGVHLRLGDYLTAGKGRFKAVVQGYRSFLRSAFAWFERAHPGATFVVLCGRHKGCAVKGSCDHEHDAAGGEDMCQGLLPPSNRDTAIYSEGLTEGEDMALLLSCNGAIVTAGSYGWWGGFLTGGDVVAFGEPYSGDLLQKWSRDDFFPPEWVLFDAHGNRVGRN